MLHKILRNHVCSTSAHFDGNEAIYFWNKRNQTLLDLMWSPPTDTPATKGYDLISNRTDWTLAITISLLTGEHRHSSTRAPKGQWRSQKSSLFRRQQRALMVDDDLAHSEGEEESNWWITTNWLMRAHTKSSNYSEYDETHMLRWKWSITRSSKDT